MTIDTTSEPKPFSYATQKFTPLGGLGAIVFVGASLLTPFLYFQAINSYRPYGSNDMMLFVFLSGAAWIASIPLMLVGRGLIYTQEPPTWMFQGSRPPKESPRDDPSRGSR